MVFLLSRVWVPVLKLDTCHCCDLQIGRIAVDHMRCYKNTCKKTPIHTYRKEKGFALVCLAVRLSSIMKAVLCTGVYCSTLGVVVAKGEKSTGFKFGFFFSAECGFKSWS